jgi:cytosine/adenosine deaminase-related metal-dependent hydrolase
VASQPPLRLTARFVFTADGPARRDAVVTITDGRIEAIGKRRANDPAIDLGNVAILPGFVNAHTHLEFSDLKSPLAPRAKTFADWLRKVIAYRRGRTDAQRRAAIIKGLAECRRFGTTCVGEIATSAPIEAPWHAMNGSCEATIFLESIGLRAKRADESYAASAEHVGHGASGDIRVGLSPHAPYTVQPALVRRLASLSAVAAAPLAMHLAETREELELLRTGGGPLHDLLVELDAWQPDIIPHASAPLDYLRLLSNAHRALVIHGNYLTDEEIAFIAARRDRMAIVYCPRTHAFFGHSPYPLAKLLKAGAVVALGTDSRASNPDLNLLAEMRHVAMFLSVSPARIVEMATINGATALGRAAELGSLTLRKRADLAIIRLPDSAINDPYELLFNPLSRVETTIHRGEVIAGVCHWPAKSASAARR